MTFLWVGIGSMVVPLCVGMGLWWLGRGACMLWYGLFPPAVNMDPDAPPPALLPPGWAVMTVLCGVASVPAWILAAPNAAQSEHLWQRLRGYPATVLTVPLQHDDPAQQQAVLALLEPLRTLGSRRIGVHQQGRHGGWTDTDVVPAYIRVQDKHLQVALARALPAEVLAHFEQLLQVLQDGDVAQQAWALVAAWHCRLQETRPLEPWGPHTPQLRAMQQRIRQCEGPRSEALAQAVALLAGQTGTLEIEQTERFSPWWSRPGWSRWTPVPEADALQP